MTGDQVYDLIDGAMLFLASEAPGRIELDVSQRPGVGLTRESMYSGSVFSIGVAGLEGNHSELSDYDAMKPVVALFHEVCGHGGQLKYEFMKDTPLSRVLALNNYACKSSGTYYDGNARPGVFSRQYARQPNEIAAQYMALRSARTYLPREIGEARTDEMLLAYVNGRVADKSEFVGRFTKYKSMDAVFHDFDVVFRRCYDAHRAYDIKSDPYGPVMSHHRLWREMRAKGVQTDGVTDDMLLRMVYGTGMEQDLMMCAAAIASDHTFAAYFEKPVFDGIDMSISSAFCKMDWRDKPKVGRSQFARLMDMVEEADRKDFESRDGPDMF